MNFYFQLFLTVLWGITGIVVLLQKEVFKITYAITLVCLMMFLVEKLIKSIN